MVTEITLLRFAELFLFNSRSASFDIPCSSFLSITFLGRLFDEESIEFIIPSSSDATVGSCCGPIQRPASGRPGLESL